MEQEEPDVGDVYDFLKRMKRTLKSNITRTTTILFDLETMAEKQPPGQVRNEMRDMINFLNTELTRMLAMAGSLGVRLSPRSQMYVETYADSLRD